MDADGLLPDCGPGSSLTIEPRGEADALDALSEAMSPECLECWEEVRGDTRPF